MARITLPSGARRTYASFLRAVELALVSFVSTLAATFVGDAVEHASDRTLTHAIDVVQSGWDGAGGVALAAFLGGFGISRSNLKNISPVVAPGGVADVADPDPDTDSNGGLDEGEQVA